MSKKRTYIADENRYNKMSYRRAGNSGLLLPEISLGLWHNFGDHDNFKNARNLLKCAFDNGITHFDLTIIMDLSQVLRKKTLEKY